MTVLRPISIDLTESRQARMGRTPTEKELTLCKVGNGALAGIAGVSVSFPLDLIKTKFQLNKAEYKGKFINAARAVHMERGLLGLYGGCAINLLLITPEKAIKLVVNDKMRTRLTDKDGNLGVQKQIIAGATAGACQCIVTSPMEMFKIAGQTGVPVGEMWRQRTAGRIGAISKMQGVYTGFCATLLRDIPFSMIYFPAYAIIRDVMAKNMLKPGEDPTFAMNFGSGLASGLVGALAVTPMDCIKTRIQKHGGAPWIEAAKGVYSEGYKLGGHSGAMQALFNGGLARGIVVGVLFGAAQVMYELKPTEKMMGFNV